MTGTTSAPSTGSPSTRSGGRIVRGLVAIAAIGLLLAACSDDSDSSSSTTRGDDRGADDHRRRHLRRRGGAALPRSRRWRTSTSPPRGPTASPLRSTTVKTDLEAFGASASDELQPQVEAVQAGVDSLETAIDGFDADGAAPVVAAVSTVADSVTALVEPSTHGACWLVGATGPAELTPTDARSTMMSTSDPGVSAETLHSISTPDRVESRIGTLEFDDGAPTDATAALLYDNLDFVHGVQAYLGSLPRRIVGRNSTWIPLRRGRGQLVLVLPRADGFGVALPDGELRHAVLLGVHRPLGRPDGHRRPGARRPVRDPRHGRRHVVPLGDRRRPPGSGSKRRWPLPDGRAGLRRPAARQRLPRVAGPHEPRHPDRARLHDRQRSDRRRRRRSARACGSTRTSPVPTALPSRASSPATPHLGAAAPVPETTFVDVTGKSFNTIFPNDFGYWELDPRAPAAGGPRSRRPRAARPPRRRSASSTASRSRPTTGCARSSRKPSRSATPPPAP